MFLGRERGVGLKVEIRIFATYLQQRVIWKKKPVLEFRPQGMTNRPFPQDRPQLTIPEVVILARATLIEHARGADEHSTGIVRHGRALGIEKGKRSLGLNSAEE
jgi:hypothetical protein